MKPKEILVQITALLYIALFAYAALSKLLNYEDFQRQLSLSPVLTSHAGWLSWLVPFLELVLATLLIVPKTRNIGMLGSFNLMVSFTIYIYLIINHASHIPCSCGGILESLGWREHLYFNLAFIALAVLALINTPHHIATAIFNKAQYRIFLIGVTGVLSAAATLKLFLVSEQIVHFENRFERRFPHPSVTEITKVDLKLNSYYIAGIDHDSIYLGNITAPLHVRIYGRDLKQYRTKKIQLADPQTIFRSTQVRVHNGKFLLFNGTVPYIFEGSTSTWIAKKSTSNIKRFTQAEPLNQGLAVRTFTERGSNTLGFQSLQKNTMSTYFDDLLRVQIDGTFDTDGLLLTNESHLIYLYRYRNQFLVVAPTGQLTLTGKTIDTISKAQLDISRGKNGKKRLEKLPLVVNKTAALYQNMLFINSKIPGKNDNEKLWKQASVIDVYNIDDGSYRFSFPLYDINGRKMDSFKVYKNKVFLINENWMVQYDLNPKVSGLP